MLQSGSAAEDLVLVLGVKKLVDVGVGVEEGLGRGGQQRVLHGESSLDNPVNIAHNIMMALCQQIIYNIVMKKIKPMDNIKSISIYKSLFKNEN